MIYTSYYANHRKWAEHLLTEYQISNTKPKWWSFDIAKIDELIPPWALVDGYKKGTVTEKQFETAYTEQLNASGINSQYLSKLLVTEDILLLCWEKPGQFCHRHILREWLNSNNCKCEEYV
jgi:uncharacterized protein YeaO (DUF488 family)